MAAVSYSQIIDDFSDADLSSNPQWFGNSGLFTVSIGQLQLNDVAGGKAQLSTAYNWKDTASWSIDFIMDFEPSSSNSLKIYLSFSNTDLESNGNGYYLKIGKSGSDDNIEFYRQDGGNSVKLFDGTATVFGAQPSRGKLKVTRNKKGEFALSVLDTGKVNTPFESFKVFDNTYSSGSFFGMVCTYTSSRADKFYFDNVALSPEFKDTEPPKVDQIQVVSKNQIRVFYNEALDSASASNSSNYSINSQNPINVVFDGSANSILLTWPFNFSNGIYTLNINGIKDLAGNSLNGASSDFIYKALARRDVVISEIFFDPTPIVGLPNAEFVELYNRSDFDIELSGFQFSDATSTKTLSAAILPAKSYLILCSKSNESLFAPFGAVLPIDFPSLNNSGDDLTLKSPLGEIIDQVNYKESWYNDVDRDDGGYSIELINAEKKCSSQLNWVASRDASGGTPGKQNSVFSNIPDITAPDLEGVKIIGLDSVLLIFNETLDSALAAKASFQLLENSKNIGVSSVRVGDYPFTEILLVLEDTLAENIAYDLDISGLFDCEGNELKATIKSAVVYLVAKPAQLYDLVISEIFADPEPSYSLPTKEFIEIYNRASYPIQLKNFVLFDATGSTTLPEYILPAGNYLILSSSTAAQDFSSYGKTLAVSGFPSLNNSGEQLVLRDSLGKLVVAVNYQQDWHVNDDRKDGGYSLEMIDVNSPCYELGNWTSALSGLYGSPGAENTVADANSDQIPPSVLSVIPSSNKEIIITFSEKLDSVWLLDNVHFELSEGVSIESVSTHGITYNKATLKLADSLLPNTLYELKLTNITDCSGNITASYSAKIALPTMPDSLDLVINEVLFNPVNGGSDYIEIYNRSQKYFDLRTLAIGQLDEFGQIGKQGIVGENGFLLAPEEYALFTADTLNVYDNYVTKGRHRLIESEFMPSMADNEGGLVLINENGNKVDALQYFDDWHHPLIKDKNGVSLERISSNEPTQNSHNWHSASSAAGYGTPGYKNSQSSSEFGSNETVSLSSNTLSPDGDGFEDYVEIKVSATDLNSTVAISIHNLAGVLTAQLVKNDILGSESIYTWNGTTSLGEKAPIGAYIILVEVVNTNGSVQTIKKPIAIAAKF
ncbi:MAG: lamin tail domain-containing protein [Bacteroidetes bacterium]|nr:lamin tail domain-containing protein [Bacteroidota bacterium]